MGLAIPRSPLDFNRGGLPLRIRNSLVGVAAAPQGLLLVSILVNLGILSCFKYFDFFAFGLNDLLGRLGITLDPLSLQLILPIGISFYTFQSVGYTVDVYRRELKPCKNPWDLALFVAFFPQLVAGPIDRAACLCIFDDSTRLQGCG